VPFQIPSPNERTSVTTSVTVMPDLVLIPKKNMWPVTLTFYAAAGARVMQS